MRKCSAGMDVIMKTYQSKSSQHYGIWGIVIIFVWTGILIWSASKHYYFSEILERRVLEMIVQKGVSNTVAFDYAKEEEEGIVLAKKILSQTSTLSYVIQNSDDLPAEQGQNIVKVVSYFSGNQSKGVFWSGAASQKVMETALFERSDGEIAKLAAKEEKESKKSENPYGDTESSRVKAEKETVEQVTPSITVFNNGSPDITASNRTDSSAKEERDHLGKLQSDSKEKLAANLKMIQKLKASNSRTYLLKKFYITDSSTSIDPKIFQIQNLLNMNLKIKKSSKPQILIIHTHGASESFADSRKGKEEDSIIGVGDCLAKVLSEKYGYQVLHDRTAYDKVNGKIDRNKAYNQAYNGLKQTLGKYPSIQTVIDLHRDGVGKKVKRTTIVDGKQTAQVMFFNGLSRSASGEIAYLHNDNLQGNLASGLFKGISLQYAYEAALYTN